MQHADQKFTKRMIVYASNICHCLIGTKGWVSITIDNIMITIFIKEYIESSKIVHFKKRSGRSKSEGLPLSDRTRKLRAQTIIYFYDTMRIFYDQYYREKYGRLVRAVVLLGIYLFTKVKLLRNRFV